MNADLEKQKLKNTNINIGEEEQKRDANADKFFRDILSDQLIFRRVDGTVVDKGIFLDGLKKNNPFKSRESQEINVTLINDRALVTLIVRVVRQDGTEGHYRNIRVFFKKDGRWRLEFWYNYDITSL